MGVVWSYVFGAAADNKVERYRKQLERDLWVLKNKENKNNLDLAREIDTTFDLDFFNCREKVQGVEWLEKRLHEQPDGRLKFKINEQSSVSS